MKRYLATLSTLLMLLAAAADVRAQSFAIELMNNVMPASGAMAGAGNARPQDLQSAINGNPATLTQYRGTQFSTGGVWIEPTYNLTVGGAGLPAFGVTPFSNAKSDAQGVAGGNLGVTQDFTAYGLPVTTGVGVMSGAGAGVDFRHVPEANGTHANIVALDIIAGAGVALTDRLSAGVALTLSNATLDGPFVGLTGSSSDYAIRGSIGLNYEVTCNTTAGLFYKTKAGYTFENLARFPAAPTTFQDIAADRPQILGMGIANTSLMDGRLLIAIDGVYQQYTPTDLFGAIFQDQWAIQIGTQFSPNDRVRLRLGYAWNEDPTRSIVSDGAGGILPPGGAAHVQYVEALFAAITPHRVTGGVGVRDLLPGVDLDLFAGGSFQTSKTFGVTTATVQSYWVGTGITWRFGRGSCEAGS